MDLEVFTPPSLASEAKRFLAPFEVRSIVRSMTKIEPAEVLGDRCLIYLSGREGERELATSLKLLAQAKRRRLIVVLYAARADQRCVVHWVRVAERTLPNRTEFCFSASEVAHTLRLRPRRAASPAQSPPGARVDIERLRSALGLTQTQLALAIGVSERTVQNWEAGRVSPQAERRLRDVVELNDTLERYIAPAERQSWLIAPNDAFAGAAPRDWIIEGRARDLQSEFRRMQIGEPM
jgi:DNA-binding transcriptional regulator YiaG